MASEQLPGGGIQSNRRQVRPNADPEQSDVPVIKQPEEPAVPSEFDHDRTGINPRRCSTPSPPAVSASLSRTSSSCSSSGVLPGSSVPLPHSPLTSTNCHSHQHPQRPCLEPPVTKTTLSELDVGKILLNPKLRHDINFDPELHFRPNLDGTKGLRKQERANQFWDALLEQLRLFVTDRPAFTVEYGGPESRDWCLPLLLPAVKDIIMTLVPVRDRAFVDEGLDADLLLQQFHHGVADLEKLARWLAAVLKSHCAPMRDEWVDETYTLLSAGNRDNDLQELVRGLRSLLNVLEAMKLDVANHQIRCLRPVLIEDTVHFEQRYHAKRMRRPSSSPQSSAATSASPASSSSKPKLDPDPAASWYRDAVSSLAPSLTPSDRRLFGDSAIFFHALLRLLMPSADDRDIPHLHVFQFDEDRLSKLRCDVLDAINLEVCMRVYDELDVRCRASTAPPLYPSFLSAVSSPAPSPSLSSYPSPSIGLTASPRLIFADNPPAFRSPAPSSSSAFLQPPVPNTAAFSSPSSEWSGNLDFSSLLFPPSRQGSRPPSFIFSDAGSVASSPRASVLPLPMPSPAPVAPLLSFSTPVQPATSQVDVAESKARRRDVYFSLVALLQTAPPASRPSVRWQTLSPYMALQILRSTPASLDLLPALEAELASHVSNPLDSALFREVEADFQARLVAELSRRVAEFKSLAGVNLFAAATGSRVQGPVRNWDSVAYSVSGRGRERDRDNLEPVSARLDRRTQDGRDPLDDGGVEDMACRIAHVGVLHWRVWAPILYNHCLGDLMEVEQP